MTFDVTKVDNFRENSNGIVSRPGQGLELHVLGWPHQPGEVVVVSILAGQFVYNKLLKNYDHGVIGNRYFGQEYFILNFCL